MTLQRRVNDVRLLWRSIPPKGHRIIHVLWPSWIGVICFFSGTPLLILNGYHRWPTFSLDCVGLVFLAISWFRLRPLLREFQEKMEALTEEMDKGDRPPLP